MRNSPKHMGGTGRECQRLGRTVPHRRRRSGAVQENSSAFSGLAGPEVSSGRLGALRSSAGAGIRPGDDFDPALRVGARVVDPIPVGSGGAVPVSVRPKRLPHCRQPEAEAAGVGVVGAAEGAERPPLHAAEPFPIADSGAADNLLTGEGNAHGSRRWPGGVRRRHGDRPAAALATPRPVRADRWPFPPIYGAASGRRPPVPRRRSTPV